MLRLFGSLRNKFLAENRISKYLLYAVGEILLVVIGILIALQVDNANDVHKDRLLERNYLNQLNEDFKQNKEEFNRVMQGHEKLYMNCDSIIALFPIIPNPEVFAELSKFLPRTFFIYTFDPVNTTIQSMTNTNSFQVIRNPDLRRLLTAWPDLVADFRQVETTNAEFNKVHYGPFFNTHFNFDFDFTDPRTNFNDLHSLEFENLIRLQSYANLGIVNNWRVEIIRDAMDRIIALTETTTD